MIGFVDQRPTLEPLGDGFRLTLPSGDAAATFHLTRHAFAALQRATARAEAEREIADTAAPLAFPKKRRARR